MPEMMGSYVGALIFVIAIIVLIQALGTIEKGRIALRRTQTAFATLANKELSEEERERSAQSAAIQLFADFGRISVRAGLAFLVPLAVVALLDMAGLVSLNELLDKSISPVILVISTLIAIGVFWRFGSAK
jgi:hypothetical protein